MILFLISLVVMVTLGPVLMGSGGGLLAGLVTFAKLPVIWAMVLAGLLRLAGPGTAGRHHARSGTARQRHADRSQRAYAGPRVQLRPGDRRQRRGAQHCSGIGTLAAVISLIPASLV